MLDILEKRTDAHSVVSQVGKEIKGDAGDPLKNFKNGFNQLEWTLDGAEDNRLNTLFPGN